MPATSRNLIALCSALKLPSYANSHVVATIGSSLGSRPCWIAVLLDGSKVQPKRTEEVTLCDSMIHEMFLDILKAFGH